MVNEPQRRIDGYGPEDMAIPEWKMIQGTGGDWAKGLGGKPGQFHNAGSDEIIDELNLVVVDILTGRARWSEEISDAGPLCASLDAKGSLSLNGDDCNLCPFRLDTPWASDARERRKMCCLNYTILGITINDLMPCIIRAHGISALPVRQLISQLRLNRALKGEYFRAIVSIKSQEKTGKYGTAYALHPKIVQLITDQSKAEELRIESNRLLGASIPLQEGRPEEEENPPLGFTPEGIPFYSEVEKDRLLASVQQTARQEDIKAAEKLAEQIRQTTAPTDQAAKAASTAVPPAPTPVTTTPVEPPPTPTPIPTTQTTAVIETEPSKEKSEKTEEKLPVKAPLDLDF